MKVRKAARMFFVRLVGEVSGEYVFTSASIRKGIKGSTVYRYQVDQKGNVVLEVK